MCETMKWLLESQCKLPFSESDGRRADRPSAVCHLRRDGGVGHQGRGAQVEGPARKGSKSQLDPILISQFRGLISSAWKKSHNLCILVKSSQQRKARKVPNTDGELPFENELSGYSEKFFCCKVPRSSLVKLLSEGTKLLKSRTFP